MSLKINKIEYEYRTNVNGTEASMLELHIGAIPCSDPEMIEVNRECFFHMRPYSFEYLQTLKLIGLYKDIE